MCLVYGGIYVLIGFGFNVGIMIVIEVVEDVVIGLVFIKYDYIKFLEIEV